MPKKTSRYKPVPQQDPSVRVVSSRITYEAPVFYVTSEQVVEPNGKQVRRDLVRHPGSVVIMALDESRENDPRVLLIRQYRYAAGQSLWELPAGRIDEGESALTAAKRELVEETGYSAREWKEALFFYASPGFMDETMAIYLARDLVRGKATPEDDEEITSRLFPIDAAVKLVMNGTINDGKTIAGLLWLAQKLAPQKSARKTTKNRSN